MRADGSGEDGPARAMRQAALDLTSTCFRAHPDEQGNVHVFAHSPELSTYPIFICVAKIWNSTIDATTEE
jgi:hypothetical protein